MYGDRPIRRSAIRSRLLTNRLVRTGAVGGRPRPLGAPLRPRYARKARTGSATMLMRKRKPSFLPPQKLEATGGSITRSVSVLSHRPSKQVVALKRVGAPNHHTTNSNDFQGVGAGFQLQWSYAWLDNTALSYLRNNLGNIGSGSYRYCIESFTVEQLVTNTTNAPIELEIWDLVLKKDLQTAMTYYGVAGVEYPITATPASYWQQGSLVDAGLPPTTPTPYNSQFLGASPYDVQLFRDYFKQVKKTIVMLPQGASHRHLVVRKTNRVIDDAFIRQGGIAGHKGLTSYTMFNVKGFPCASASPESTEGFATTTGAQLAIVNTMRYKYTWVQDVSNFNVNVDNLQSPTPINQNIINIGSGQLDTFKDYIPGAP